MRAAAKLVSLYWHYLSWQPTMKLSTLAGIGLLLLGLATIWHPLGVLPVILGLILAPVIPVVFAGVAYRLLIANKRLLLVPDFRTTAAWAMLLLAVSGGLVAAVFAVALGRDPVYVITVSLLAFSLISAHLLLTQWLAINALGLLLGLMASPLLLTYISVETNLLNLADLRWQWPVPVLAMLGWARLLRLARSPVVPKPAATDSWLNIMSGQHSFQFSVRGIASPGGTLLRAAPDSWRSRIISTLVFVGILILTILIILLLTRPDAGEDRGLSIPHLILVCTFLGLLAQQSAGTAEWPARLRLLWLRMAGDRQQGWQHIEQSLLGDTMIVGLTTSLVAAAFLWLSDLQPATLLLYVAATVLANLFCGYLAFWARARGWAPHVPQLLIGLGVLLGMIAFALSQIGSLSLPWTQLIAGLAVLIPVLRMLARRRLLRADWCAVRPVVRGGLTR